MTNDMRLWLYPGANPNTGPDTWEPYFADISAYVRRPGQSGGRPITYSWGKQDESTTTDAGQMSLTLDNRDGRFSTDNANGPYYEAIDTGTPIRLGVAMASDTFTRIVATGLGTYRSTPSQVWNPAVPSAWLVDGSKAQGIVFVANAFTWAFLGNTAARDADITSTIYPNYAATGAAYGGGHVVRSASDGNNMLYSTIEFNTAGDVTVKIRQIALSVTFEMAALNPIPASSYTAGVPWKLRTQVDGSTMRAMAWPASGSPPTTWQATFSNIQQPTDFTGSDVGIIAWRFNGNTNSSSLPIIGFDSFEVISLEWTGFVTSWPNEWDMTGNNSWAAISCSGILSRLRQGTNPVQSPLRHQLQTTADSVSYWPMEDGVNSTSFANTVTGGKIGSFSAVTLAEDSTLAGGGPAPALAADTGFIALPVTGGVNSGGTGFSAMVFIKLPSLPAAKTRIVTVSPRSGPVATYAFSILPTTTTLEALDTSGAVIATVTNNIVTDWTQWMAWQLEVDNTAGGGNTSVSGAYHQVGQAVYYAQTFNVTGTTLSNIGGMKLTGPQGTNFAHAWLGRNTLPFVTNSFSLVSAGYAGEAAIDRWKRITSEAGLVSGVAGVSSNTSIIMGVQSEGNTMAILQSVADTDYATYVERAGGLEMIPRDTRWNPVSLYTLSKAAGEIGDIPKPVRDDQRLKNTVTVSRTGGSSATYADTASVARNGTWQDSATVNEIDDGNLSNQASWRVFVGTARRSRWPVITLNFARSPQLIYLWGRKYYGFRFGVTTGTNQFAGNEPDLVMEGFQASLDPEVWTVDMNCTDARTWLVGTTDNHFFYQAEFTTLGASLTTTGTTLTFSISDASETWKVGASTATVIVKGEEIKLGTVGAVSGTGPWTQVVTGCTRSMNSIVKTHASGEQVLVKNALRATL
jgi:hypothetical protein